MRGMVPKGVAAPAGLRMRYLAAHRGAERFRQARADRHLLAARLQALERSDDFLALERGVAEDVLHPHALRR